MTHNEPDKLTYSFSQMEDMWFEGRKDANISLILTAHISQPVGSAEAHMRPACAEGRQGKIARGERRPITPDEFERFKELFK